MEFDITITLCVFAIGLFLGSFFNVVGLRILSGENVAFPPSHCTTCNHRLGPLDLVPVLSWLFLGGKCRYCKDKISKIYPFGELLTGIGYAIVVNKFGLTFEALIHAVFITFMTVSTVTDLKERIVPDRIVVAGVLLVGALRIYSGEQLTYYLMSAGIAFGLLLLILILSKGKMGGADVKLYLLIGLAIGLENAIVSLFYASFITLIWNFKLLFNKDKDNPVEIPFVPYITLGILLVYIVNVYNLSIL